MAVNAVRIVATALERRPVLLSEKEEQLYRIAFTSIEKKEFLKLIGLARWVECSPGDVILEKGRPISDVTVLISGEAEAMLTSETRIAFRPGQLIGDVSVYSGLAGPVDVVARGCGTVVKWDWLQLLEFMASSPALRAKLLTLVSTDLAAKLREIAVAVSGFVAEQPAA
jgi:CRP-like cAMP-binding protein